jgi:inorganic pyrophosphatase
MNILNDIDKSLVTPEKFTAVVEIPMGSKLKYEIDKATGLLKLDRILKTTMVYPANYGFIPRTLSADGDPLDVLVCMNEVLEPLCLVDCIPVAVIYMVDNGECDEKILAVPTFKGSTYKSVPEEQIAEIVHFCKQYKALQKDNNVEITRVGDRHDALKVIADAIALYSKKGGKKK